MSEPVKILVLWRQPDTLSLWGIPYRMRPGQQCPLDLWRARESYIPLPLGHYGAKPINLDDWVWLGSPGWWGEMSAGNARREAIEAFVRQNPTWIPDNPCEWTDLTECGVDLVLPGE